ncbi:hypothetical protein ANACOL_02535 [Anaerotruncus colihominis DSM 17241]|uniref:Uncharacterized protein n=1 Tax=Anaerotruncus colihominis DSM 17241 TaxID=445972 RepID=B0PCM2_9FIRM|nr:hypothetical protein ANACOL_02535 [Anaerotruncus colihominis DSM 17241]
MRELGDRLSQTGRDNQVILIILACPSRCGPDRKARLFRRFAIEKRAKAEFSNRPSGRERRGMPVDIPCLCVISCTVRA